MLIELAKERVINKYIWDFKDDREDPRGLEKSKHTIHLYCGKIEAFEGVMAAGYSWSHQKFWEKNIIKQSIYKHPEDGKVTKKTINLDLWRNLLLKRTNTFS